jgi:hypothetical protein
MKIQIKIFEVIKMKVNKQIIGNLIIIIGMFLSILLSILFDTIFIFIGYFFLLILFSYVEVYPISKKVNLFVKTCEYQECIEYLKFKISNNFLVGTNNFCVIELIALFMLTDQVLEAKRLLVSNPKLAHSSDLMYIRFIIAVAEESEENIKYYADKISKLRQPKYKQQQENVNRILEMLKNKTMDNEVYENTKYPLLKRICQKINGEDIMIESLVVEKEEQIIPKFEDCNGTRKIIKKTLNIITICTLPFAMILLSTQTYDSVTALESSYNSLKLMWILYLFLPISIGNIVYSLNLKAKNYKYKSNFIIGIVFSVLLFLYGSMYFMSIGMFSDDKNYLFNLEEEINIDLPDDFTIVTQDYTGGEQTSTDNCLIKYESVVRISEVNTSYFENKYWINEISTPEMLPTLFVFQTKSYEKYLIYCTDTKEYNPTNYIENYNYIALAFDNDNNILMIYEFVSKG